MLHLSISTGGNSPYSIYRKGLYTYSKLVKQAIKSSLSNSQKRLIGITEQTAAERNSHLLKIFFFGIRSVARRLRRMLSIENWEGILFSIKCGHVCTWDWGESTSSFSLWPITYTTTFSSLSLTRLVRANYTQKGFLLHSYLCEPNHSLYLPSFNIHI